ncbi:MAG: radical SAM protein, partial [Planctomycetota bacterium]|nr:radical SAM protein [Planctomycetota bacterium]
MTKFDKSKPMPVKHWSFAGLMLTYWCNARCASCYVCSSPSDAGDMTVESALAFWEGLQNASPHGCRIHIGGGEPFGRWEILIELLQQAKSAGLGPLEAVETNAFWACDEKIIRERLAALDEAGMDRLTISADPY